MVPTVPWAIDPSVRPGRPPSPRQFEYPTGWNLPTGPRSFEPISFQLLRGLAKYVDIIRIAIETIKREVATADWQVVVNEDVAKLKGKDYLKDERQALHAFFEEPDPIRDLQWDEWVRALLEDVLVVDAMTIDPRQTLLPGRGVLGSDLIALRQIDGTTIKPLLNNQGERPLPPGVAYQQFMFGVPRTEFIAATDIDEEYEPVASFSSNELIYRPFNPVTFSPWGMPPTEQSLINAKTYFGRTQWWQAQFTDGDVPAGFLMGPEGASVDELERFESVFNSWLAGDPRWKHRIKFVPYGANYQVAHQPVLDIAVDEHLIKLLLAPFHIQPQSLGFTPHAGLGGKGFAEEQTEIQDRKSVEPYLRWIAKLMTRIIRRYFKIPDLEFVFTEIKVDDAIAKSAVHKVFIDAGVETRNHAADDMGWDTSDDPMADTLTVTTPDGVIPLADIQKLADLKTNPPPPPPMIGPDGKAIAPKLPPGGKPGAGPTSPQKSPPARPGGAPASRGAQKPPGTIQKAAQLELAAFTRFAKRDPKRPFTFQAVDPAWGNAINATLTKAGPVLAQVRAAQAAAVAALVDNGDRLLDGEDDYDTADFSDDGQHIIRDAAIAAFLFGVGHYLGRSGAHPSAGTAVGHGFTSSTSAAAVDAAARQGSKAAAEATPYLSQLAEGLSDGTITRDQMVIQAGLQAGIIWSSQFRGQHETQGPGGTIIWHTSGDDEVCALCDPRDGVEYTDETLPGYPGEGTFGDLCDGGPNDRCELEFVSPTTTDEGDAGDEADQEAA